MNLNFSAGFCRDNHILNDAIFDLLAWGGYGSLNVCNWMYR